MHKLMNKLGFKKRMHKIVRTFSWAVGIFLIISLFMGGIAAYGVSYKGIDMPVGIHSHHEEINWAVLMKEENRFLVGKELSIREKIFIFKAVRGYIGQTGCIGRGPPMAGAGDGFLPQVSFMERIKQNLKYLMTVT